MWMPHAASNSKRGVLVNDHAEVAEQSKSAQPVGKNESGKVVFLK